MIKEYCTQNNGNCKTCSFVNYGRDCQNNKIKRFKMSRVYIVLKGNVSDINEAKKPLKNYSTYYYSSFKVVKEKVLKESIVITKFSEKDNTAGRYFIKSALFKNVVIAVYSRPMY